MTLSAKTSLSIVANFTKAFDLVTGNAPLSLTLSMANSDSSAFPADVIFSDTRELTTGQAEELALDDGSLKDIYLDDAVFADVKLLYIRNTSAVDSLLIGGAAGTIFPLLIAVGAEDSILKLPFKGELLLMVPTADGLTVGVNGDLKIQHGAETGASLEYDIIIIGNSS